MISSLEVCDLSTSFLNPFLIRDNKLNFNTMQNLEGYEFSLLRNASRMKVESEPFPHLLIENALPDESAAELTSSFPIEEFQIDENNARKDIPVYKLSENANISDVWKEFICFHRSSYFLSQFLHVFREHLLKDNALRVFTDRDNLRAGRRRIHLPGDTDVLMEAQISINTPVNESGSVLGVHVDNSNKLFAGLFYLRKPEDDSVGGNLRLYSWKKGYTMNEKIKAYKGGALDEHVTLAKEIKYESNVFVLWPNSLDALHAVSPRQRTKYARTFVNLHGLMPFDGFQKGKVSFLENKVRQLKKVPSYIKRKLLV